MDTRAALFIDFDNVLGGLLRLDPSAALRFAEDPGGWVERLADHGMVARRRRFLVKRCYLNPGGWVPNPDPVGNPKLFFSTFRGNFVRAGFEVVDCPRLAATKNAADIRMVMDALDALSAGIQYDEFVIFSGDSDLTPLLVRLRAHDRLTILVSPFDASEALTNVADRFVPGDQFLDLLEESQADDDSAGENLPFGPIALPPPATGASTEGDPERAAALVRQAFSDTDGRINLAQLGHQLRGQFGVVVRPWFGHGTLKQWLRSLELPHLEMSQHEMWDGSRFQPPELIVLPPAVEKVSRVLDIPKLASESWQLVLSELANYSANHEYTLNEASRVVTSAVQASRPEVNRQSVLFAIRAVTYGGAPPYAEPTPKPTELGIAMARNVIKRALAADCELAEDEQQQVRDWFEL